MRVVAVGAAAATFAWRALFAADTAGLVQLGLVVVGGLGAAATVYTAITSRKATAVAHKSAEDSRAFSEMEKAVVGVGEYARGLEGRIAALTVELAAERAENARLRAENVTRGQP